MNLRLYAETKLLLARLPADAISSVTIDPGVSLESMTLPDSLFEELGYFGALAEDDSETHGTDNDKTLDELFRVSVEFALSF